MYKLLVATVSLDILSMTMIYYFQNVLQCIIPLPSAEEFEKLVAKRRVRMAQQIEKREAQMNTMHVSFSFYLQCFQSIALSSNIHPAYVHLNSILKIKKVGRIG